MRNPIESKPARPMEIGYCLTVLSNDAALAACPECKQKRVLFHAHYFAFAGDDVRCRCKSCHEAAAKERGGEIFVKSHGRRSLPLVWKNNRFVEAPPEKLENLQKGREEKMKRLR